MPSELVAEVLFEKVTGPYWAPSIELPTSLGALDLHNFASFTRLTYDTAGLLELEWQADPNGGVLFGPPDTPRRTHGGIVPITAVKLIFSGVQSFTMTPRDPEMPAEEDHTLDHFLVHEARPGHYRLFFSFLGGIDIDVTASDFQVRIIE